MDCELPLGMIHVSLILDHDMGMKYAEEPFNMGMSVKMGIISDPQTRHPGIFILESPHPPPPPKGGASPPCRVDDHLGRCSSGGRMWGRTESEPGMEGYPINRCRRKLHPGGVIRGPSSYQEIASVYIG